VKDIKINEHGFEATTVPPHTLIVDSYHYFHNILERSWNVSSSWHWFHILGNGFATYGGWQIWLESELVKQVEALCLAGKNDEAMKLLIESS
jgi:hypothetical protein